jgi:hypothetical protein
VLGEEAESRAAQMAGSGGDGEKEYKSPPPRKWRIDISGSFKNDKPLDVKDRGLVSQIQPDFRRNLRTNFIAEGRILLPAHLRTARILQHKSQALLFHPLEAVFPSIGRGGSILARTGLLAQGA